MAVLFDRQLVAELESDPSFQKMLRTINYDGNRYFRHAWVMYEAERGSPVIKKWYPVLMEDRETRIIGFEYNPGGWKSKTKAGKCKITLAELLSIIIRESHHVNDTVRCSYGEGSKLNGRLVENMQFDSGLSSLLNKFKNRNRLTDQVFDSKLNSDQKPVFSLEDKTLVTQSAQEIERIVQGFEGEEKDIIAKYRINQGKFRKLLLNYWGGACAVSGLSDERLLVASHILPWSKSTLNQKGDPFNGLLLSVVWDSLFDKGLISFDDSGKAILDKLNGEVINCLGLKAGKSAIKPERLTNEHRQYFQIHRVLHQFT